jgi:Ser/Thr protein kinase RdoA (MazF antagonist)
LPLADHIETAYPLAIRNMTKVRDVYRLLTMRGRVLCIKSYPIPEPEVRFIAQVLIHLAETGFRYSPRIIPTREQALWTMRKGKAFMVTNWVRGRAPNLGDRAVWEKAIQTLAEFHRHAERSSIHDVPPGRNRFAHLPNIIANYRTNLLEYQSAGNMSACVSLCDDAIRYLGGPESLEAVKHEESVRAFVHGDYNYPNLIFDRQRFIHLIDFENTSHQVRMTDLAHILHRNVAWNGEETLRWIEHYDRTRPLSSGDRHLLFALLHVPYPLIRLIRMHKSSQKIRNAVPEAKMIDQYVSSLRKII